MSPALAGGFFTTKPPGKPLPLEDPFLFLVVEDSGEKVWNVVGRILVRCESSLKEVLGYC